METANNSKVCTKNKKTGIGVNSLVAKDIPDGSFRGPGSHSRIDAGSQRYYRA